MGCLPVLSADIARHRLKLTPAQLRATVARGDLVRLRRGVLVGCCVVERAAGDAKATHRLRLLALLCEYPDAVAGHESAALARDLPVLSVPDLPRLIRSRGAWRGGAHARVRVAPLPPAHVESTHDIRATCDARTFVDIARTGGLTDAAVVGDAILRRGGSVGRLLTAVEECAAWSDVGKARRAVPLLDARSESPFESISRVTMHLGNVPAPEPQAWVQGASGAWFRADFLWRGRRLIGEADGRAKYFEDDRRTPDQVLMAEKSREDDLREAGYDFIRWTYGQMLGQPAVTVGRILRKLAH